MEIDDVIMGMMFAEEDNEEIANDAKNALIKELKQKGILLPRYDWKNKEFYNKLEEITADWFKRHPETKRGSGEFLAKYPEKEDALRLLREMSNKGRITPIEYITLYREIYNF